MLLSRAFLSWATCATGPEKIFNLDIGEMLSAGLVPSYFNNYLY